MQLFVHMSADGEFNYLVTDSITVTVNLTFRQCTVGEYYNAGDCLMCPAGSYSVKDNKDLTVTECEECPDNAEQCFGADMDLKEGYWRISAGASTILTCILPAAGCLGGWETGDASCATGYEGPLCAVCENGFFLTTSSYTCESCDNHQSGVNPFAVAILTVCFLVLLSFVYYMRANNLSTVDGVISDVMRRLGYIRGDASGEELHMLHVSRAKQRNLFFAKVKIYVTMYQIISAMPFVLDLQFPSVFNRIASAFGILAINISQEFGISCSTSYDYIDVLVVSTVTPLVVSFLIWLSYVTHLYSLVDGNKEKRVIIKSY